ncbi:MAG: sulfite exporter TauE/SafE family protein [Devosia sp.]
MDWVSYIPLVLALAGIGAVSGIFAGLLGVGGGSIMVPALAFTLDLMGFGNNIVQHVAVATSLAIIIPTGLRSAQAHYKRGAVNLDILKLWAPFVFGGTLIGGLMAGLFSGDILRLVFGVMAILIAINTISPIQKRLMGHLHASALAHRVAASITGYISALMGIGGGSFSVPTIAAFGETMHRAVGTGSAIGVFIALGGTIGFVVSGWGEAGLPPLSLGYVNLVAFVFVGGLSALTAPLGAALAHRLQQQTLRYVFAGFNVLVGINMIWRALL